MADALLMAASLINEIKQQQDNKYQPQRNFYKEENLFNLAGIR
jgi:hypothetical protein